jgi:hypothetical protein
VSFTVHPAASDPVYSIALDASGTHTFAALAPGYAAIAPLFVTVSNTGNRATGALVAALSGDSASSFALTGSSIASIAVDGERIFSVAPKMSLGEGTYTATVTVSGDNNLAASFGLSFTVDAAQAYGISLSINGTHAFPAADFGYEEPEPLTVTVTNTGNQATGVLVATLSGGSASSFALTGSSIASIAVDGTGTFTVAPKTSLVAGTYTATVTVSGGNGIASRSFGVSFTVNAAQSYGISLSVNGTHTFPDDDLEYEEVEPLTVTVTNTGTNSTGNLTVELSGDDWASFDLDRVTLLPINPGATRTFIVKPNTGLAKKTYTTDVLVYNDDIHGEFSLSFTVWNFTSAADQAAYLNKATGGTTVNNPVLLPINHGTVDWAALAGAINTAGKYVALDISTSSPAASSIEAQAFEDCAKLVSISFPAASSIGDFAFVGCRNLISVSFPAIASIGNQAFGGCTGLTEINLPASLTSIGFNPFTYCINLTTITVDSNNSQFSSRNGMLLDKAGTTLYGYPSASGTVTLSDITSIGDSAFFECTNLISVNFPEASSIGDDAFADCTSLTTANFPLVTSIGVCAFYGIGNKALSITLPQNAPTLSFATSSPNFYSKTVTVKTPAGRTGYDAAWEDLFKAAFGTGASITLNFENLE